MSAVASIRTNPAVDYPECDGLPMADNTKQFHWIVTIQGGLAAIFKDDPQVFVAGDLLWYPVEGNNTIRAVPNAFVAFGRPKGDRGSYVQWLENNIAPQVVFEVLSSGYRAGRLVSKFKFYEKYGVEEYYAYDPDRYELNGWIRAQKELVDIPVMNGWVSPRLQVRFEMQGDGLHLFGPDGKPIATLP